MIFGSIINKKWKWKHEENSHTKKTGAWRCLEIRLINKFRYVLDYFLFWLRNAIVFIVFPLCYLFCVTLRCFSFNLEKIWMVGTVNKFDLFNYLSQFLDRSDLRSNVLDTMALRLWEPLVSGQIGDLGYRFDILCCFMAFMLKFMPF